MTAAVRVGVLSDTHIVGGSRVIPPAIFAAFVGVDAILHAGDIARREVLDDLRTLAPVHAVQGNVDPYELAVTLPERLVLDLGGARIGLTHGHLGSGRTAPDHARGMFADIAGLSAVVFGHSHEPYNRVEGGVLPFNSHEPYNRVEGGVLLFNPGSPTERRRQPRPSYGMLTIENGAVRGQIIYL